jgi:hypothetical protein
MDEGDYGGRENGRSSGLGVDDAEVMKKRLQYWDYLRTGIQFISLQNRALAKVIG